MRIHRLQVEAFGAFAEPTVIDFDELATDGLFLMHGQTGAGKTTVLDAVAFALFGKVPGARDTNRRLHSDHALDRTPSVTLEATIAGRRLRITRSPEYQRSKLRGSGTTKVNARGTLVWVDGSGPDLTRLPEIGEAVSRLMGMTADQFFQVVLLPQGEFARFLRATSDERESLLERLFDTERFGDLEEWLRTRARESSADLDAKKRDLDRVAGQIVAVAGCELPADPDMDWAQGCLDAATADAETALLRRDAARADAERAETARTEGNRVAALVRRGTEAKARLAQLADEAGTVDAVTGSLAAARRAAPLASLVEDADGAVVEAARADTESDRAAAGLGGLTEGAEFVGADDAALEAVIEQWTAESGRMQPLVRRAEQRPTMVEEIDRLDSTITAAEERVAALRATIDAAPLRRARAAADLAQAREAAGQIPALEAEGDRVEALAKALQARSMLTPKLAQAEQGLRSARDSHLAARELLLDVRERRLAGMAAELAGGLVDGQPCTVCGSAEHPAPASGQGVVATGEAEEQAVSAAEQVAATEFGRVQSRLATLQERASQLDAQIGEADAEQVEADRSRVVASLSRAQRAATRIRALEKAVAAVEVEIDTARAEHDTAITERAAHREAATGLRTTLDALDADIAEMTGGRVGVAQRQAELAELCRRARVLRAARQNAERASEHRDETSRRLTERCVAAGFDDVDAVRGALVSAEQVREWESLLQQASDLRAGAEATLADAEVRAALDGEPVDVDGLASAYAAARERLDDASRINAVAAQRYTATQQFVTEFWATYDRMTPVLKSHAEIAALAELVSGRGQNARRISLRSYVLAARLEEVLVAASARLQQMSSGRYEFVHSDAVGPRGRRGGLGIEVRDEYTGAVRASTTLSGGETFFASLALALGLADVVATESGGRMLDTIFIDEGFGSLDPEALDLVMGVLDELRSGGRVVGVVTHVDEMRARIPAQLEVVRGENGSSVRVCAPVGVS